MIILLGISGKFLPCVEEKSCGAVGRPLIVIGYKYDTRKGIYFIVKDDAGSKKAGIPYLSKYPDPFYNVYICPVAHPLVMTKLFGSVNEVEPHNKSRQYGLALEEFWVTQCGWLWLCMKVSTEMTINNFWKISCYGVKIYHYDKLIGIR